MAPSMNYHQLRAQRKLLATGNPARLYVRCTGAKSYALHNLLPRLNIQAFCSSRLMVF